MTRALDIALAAAGTLSLAGIGASAVIWSQGFEKPTLDPSYLPPSEAGRPMPASASGSLDIDYRPAVALRMARLIRKYEGHPSGGLVYVGQRGARRGEDGYAQFADPLAGLLRDLRIKLDRGMTARDILARWCDPAPCNYERAMLAELGFSADERWSE